jgi:hypothetical protein
MARFEDILKKIDAAISKFQKRIPAIQRAIFADLEDYLKKLDTSNGRIKTTVANLRIINSIKSRLQKIILSPEYIRDVKEIAKAFNEITVLQNEYWRQVESSFKPKTFLKEVRNQAIADTVRNLTESGIGATISEQIATILRNNITAGGSYSELTRQLRESILDTANEGSLQKYTKQITTDAINQYNAQYTQAVSSDLGFEWFAYQGSDILTTRPFCDAMTDFRYFHISRVPDLLKAKDLYYVKDGQKTKVPIYDKTKLPHGMIPGTNSANFFVNRGGYNCGHQIRPVSAALVPADIKEQTFSSDYYKRWAKVQP